jgi:Ohr subfamily peroxiredoxin
MEIYDMKTLYTGTATVVGGREGHGKTSDGKLDLDLSVPKGLGGPGGDGTNPEQLFAVGYSACFLAAINYVAGQKHKNVGEVSITGDVHIGTGDDGGFELAVDLHCKLPGVSHDEAVEIVNEAHASVCPYSKATRGNIPVNVTVE